MKRFIELLQADDTYGEYRCDTGEAMATDKEEFELEEPDILDPKCDDTDDRLKLIKLENCREDRKEHRKCSVHVSVPPHQVQDTAPAPCHPDSACSTVRGLRTGAAPRGGVLPPPRRRPGSRPAAPVPLPESAGP